MSKTGKEEICKVTVGNRITIPKWIMNKLELKVGDWLAVFEENGKVIVIPIEFKRAHANDVIE